MERASVLIGREEGRQSVIDPGGRQPGRENGDEKSGSGLVRPDAGDSDQSRTEDFQTVDRNLVEEKWRQCRKYRESLAGTGSDKSDAYESGHVVISPGYYLSTRQAAFSRIVEA